MPDPHTLVQDILGHFFLQQDTQTVVLRELNHMIEFLIRQLRALTL